MTRTSIRSPTRFSGHASGTLNRDHQETVRRVSGSGVVVYGYDFNTSMQTEDWATAWCSVPATCCSPDVPTWCQVDARAPLLDVGINPGDVFIQDDPWVGTNHQMDTAVYAPVFVDGRLFAWVYNVVHQRELGGIEPGGFVQPRRTCTRRPRSSRR